MIMDEIEISDPLVDKQPRQLIENIQKYNKLNHDYQPTGQYPQYSQEKRF